MSTFFCKYCSTYVRENERKKHEGSFKHQNAIQKSLRELQKTNIREERDKQRAKDEVARLNGLVDGKGKVATAGGGSEISGLKDLGRTNATSAPAASTAAQRKLHAEQLAALGVELPEELKKEVTGVGGWQTISERVIEDEQPSMSLAGIKAEEDSKDDIDADGVFRGVRKRQVEGEDEEEQDRARRKAWGSSVRKYPGGNGGAADEDLDALLGGVGKSKSGEIKTEDGEEGKGPIETEESAEGDVVAGMPKAGVADAVVKEEEDAVRAVVFKKRKIKR
ncbi:hypothetical protein LTR78_008958 [Recurvomyces mirabilis]|uniref:U1-C C2H2-type zinc finger domain-containing protein n=1 Tax=Recurvomyces mirabilis TaxID=574656 RepID=A0AAE0TSH5_9PEZI|nr:hypothetical protein LTR78_008958 [Recurvomyces mirabilis]KAK5159759.1 hypothetical protein LTS14_001864 [Recurvomyces mirabilis]